jgi:(E)-4-hydroxy-3-methylbut-2-enyl-diphosphate synthase
LTGACQYAYFVPLGVVEFFLFSHSYSTPTKCRDDLVIAAGTNIGALLVDGLGDGVLLEAPHRDFEFLRDTSFNLLQGCRMRNTKTVC